MKQNELNVSTVLMPGNATAENSTASANQPKKNSVKNHPGVYVPPPLIYIACFFFSYVLQRIVPLPQTWFHTLGASITGTLLLALGFLFLLPALRRFFISKNTLVTIKPATSLQTEGVYGITRNPMYLGLLLLYTGLAQFFGNAWTLLLLPVLFLIVQSYIIRREEKYLQRAFGAEYNAYQQKVRRWL